MNPEDSKPLDSGQNQDNPTSRANTPSAKQAYEKLSGTEPKKRYVKSVLILVLALILLAVAGFFIYKALMPERIAETDNSTGANQDSAVTQSQSDQVVRVIAHVRTLLPSTGASDYAPLPHRELAEPYNFYAAGTAKDEWSLSSGRIDGMDKAKSVLKSIYDYFTKDVGAKAETVIGTATIGEITDEAPANYYRMSTDAYTCGVFMSPENSDASPYAAIGASIMVNCSPYDEYVANAKVQAPFYQAVSLVEFVYTPMLGLPTIKASQTDGYRLAEATLSHDAALVGGSMGLFYQTPDESWHYFGGTQGVLGCERFNTEDLIKAYYGEPCYSDQDQESKVGIN